MNLYGRFLVLLLRLLLRPSRLGPGQSCRTEFVVLPQDLDINLHLNNGRYLTLMDLGRLDFMGRAGMLWPALRRGWLPVLGGAEIDFYRPIGPFCKFTLETTLESWDEKWFVMRQSFFIEDRLAAVGRVKGLLLKGREKIPPARVLELSDWAGWQPEADAGNPEKPEAGLSVTRKELG